MQSHTLFSLKGEIRTIMPRYLGQHQISGALPDFQSFLFWTRRVKIPLLARPSPPPLLHIQTHTPAPHPQCFFVVNLFKFYFSYKKRRQKYVDSVDVLCLVLTFEGATKQPRENSTRLSPLSPSTSNEFRL